LAKHKSIPLGLWDFGLVRRVYDPGVLSKKCSESSAAEKYVLKRESSFKFKTLSGSLISSVRDGGMVSQKNTGPCRFSPLCLASWRGNNRVGQQRGGVLISDIEMNTRSQYTGRTYVIHALRA
jgi:hypothetical protein